jgi:hypothetical protein
MTKAKTGLEINPNVLQIKNCNIPFTVEVGSLHTP